MVKYVCTTGRGFEDKSNIEKLYNLGMSTVRFNMSYREKCMIDELIPFINKLNKDNKLDIKTMVDLGGPEIRIDIDEVKEIVKGNIYNVGEDIKVKNCDISILDIDDIIIFGDGEIRFKVIEKNSSNLKCISLNNGILRRNKKITNDKLLKLVPFLSEKDIEDIHIALKYNVDYLCISFVNKKEDIIEIKKIVKNNNIKLIAKIETVDGVNNLEEILDYVDAIMIGRGDLAVRYSIYDLPYYQKKICNIAKLKNKKIIMGTGFLASMKSEEVPTRAEVCDLYNAVLDGADEIMFAGETAASFYPENILDTANKIVKNI